MLVRSRLSRILFDRKLFDYPITLNARTLAEPGPAAPDADRAWPTCRCASSPSGKCSSLEDFFINRFGRELYATFFRDYTEKVWGVPCREITPEWGAQRVKSLSVTRVLAHALRTLGRPKGSIRQKDVETSLIDQFLYPKLGPGQLWEEVARRVTAGGGELHLRPRGGRPETAQRQRGGRRGAWTARPAKARALRRRCFLFHDADAGPLPLPGRGRPRVPARWPTGLRYRDFITVGAAGASGSRCETAAASAR